MHRLLMGLLIMQGMQQHRALLCQQMHGQSGSDQGQKLVILFYLETDIGQGLEIGVVSQIDAA